MVSTRQAEKLREVAEQSSPPNDGGEEHEERAPELDGTRSAKRAKTDKTKAKQQGKLRKKAKLSMLPEMPVDILHEIFSLVHPRDLLHISWTAKVFNEFLTSKSSRHIWQAAFNTIPKNERVPTRPSEMTEMGYANLLYGQYCMNCASGRSLISIWCALVRLCGSCVEALTTDPELGSGFDWEISAHEVIPVFDVKQNRREFAEKVLCSDRERFIEEYMAAGKSSEGVVEKYGLLVDEKSEFSDAMLRLERVAEKAKKDARVDAQKRRIEQIWEKLSEEGWREEIATHKSIYEPGLMKIKGVVMVRSLSEKAWAELQGPLNDFMRNESNRIQAQLDARRCESRIARVREIFDSFHFLLPHPHDFSPSTADICWIPEVRKVIVDGTDEDFQGLKADLPSRIPDLSAAWLEERRKFFSQLLPQDPPSLQHLLLATTFFDCVQCRESGMRIEKALVHYCYNYGYGSKHKAGFSNAASAGAFYNRAGVPWDSGFSKYQYSAEFSAIVREVVVECGENPDTVTIQEMNRKNHRFVCFGRDGKVTVLNWSEALEHKRYYRDIPCRLLRPEELPEYVPEPEDQRSVWACLHCWRVGKSQYRHERLSEVKGHLAHSHQIANPTEEDYYHSARGVAAKFKYRPGGST